MLRSSRFRRLYNFFPNHFHRLVHQLCVYDVYCHSMSVAILTQATCQVLMDEISGDEGDDAVPLLPPRAARARKRKASTVAMVGCFAYFVFVISSSPHALFRNLKGGDAIMEEIFTKLIQDGPKLLGVTVGRYELLQVPFVPPDEDVRHLLKHLPKLAGRVLRGYCAWRSMATILIEEDWPAIPANGAAHAPPPPAQPIRMRWISSFFEIHFTFPTFHMFRYTFLVSTL